ncbi:hypothetical protein ACFVQ0_16780 [Streptomyces sp. NPDC057900]|uniref:hypothetical protein n=1 Tax=Streptomyces sp. NPDC057900 TaxID=3346274 RepID=UPI0036F00C03
MKRQAPRSATALYATAATCAVIGALLWLRSRTGAGPTYSGLYLSSQDADNYSPSAWRVWSSVVPEERLGIYLLVVALVLALGARLVAVWRE